MIEGQDQDVGQDIKIGELLTSVGVVTTGDLQEAIQISRRMNLPIGRVIVMSGCISEQNFQYAIDVQSMIRDGQMDFETGIQALRTAFAKGISLTDALGEMRWAPRRDVSTNKLGELLLDTQMVSQDQLDRALEASFEQGMPLGGMLVLQGVLSAQLLPSILTAQERIRDGAMTRNQAVEDIKAAFMFWARMEEAKQRDAGSQSQGFFNAYASGAATNELQTNPVKAAPAYQEQVPLQAPTSPASSSGPEPGPSDPASLIDILKLAGFLSEEDIRRAVERALSNSEVAAKLLRATHAMDAETLEKVVQVRSLVLSGKVRTEQAVFALSANRVRGVSLQQAFNEIGIKVSD